MGRGWEGPFLYPTNLIPLPSHSPSKGGTGVRPPHAQAPGPLPPLSPGCTRRPSRNTVPLPASTHWWGLCPPLALFRSLPPRSSSLLRNLRTKGQGQKRDGQTQARGLACLLREAQERGWEGEEMGSLLAPSPSITFCSASLSSSSVSSHCTHAHSHTLMYTHSHV